MLSGGGGMRRGIGIVRRGEVLSGMGYVCGLGGWLVVLDGSSEE